MAKRTERGPLDGRNIKVIGLGGIGSVVAQALAQFLASLRADCRVWLIDGDSYEESNRSRVVFGECGNKAIVKARELATAANGAISIVPVPKYVTPRNVSRLVEERDIVFLCVDNHATRRVVSKHCSGGTLRDALLISGGNDGIEEGRAGTFGNVMIYLRKSGRGRTNPLTKFHPEIAKPADKRPDQLSCAELAQSSAPQLLFTNLQVASAMLGAFYAWLTGRMDYEEVFLDVAEGRMNPVSRQSKRA